MKKNRTNLTRSLLFAALALVAFSGIWHPLLHGPRPDPGECAIIAEEEALHGECPLCLGLFDTVPARAFSLPYSCGKPPRSLLPGKVIFPAALFLPSKPRAPPASF